MVRKTGAVRSSSLRNAVELEINAMTIASYP
jgi:hypothetical protein